jgi:hypothetical protein
MNLTSLLHLNRKFPNTGRSDTEIVEQGGRNRIERCILMLYLQASIGMSCRQGS